MLANMAFKRGTDRKQTVLFPESLDEYVAADSPVRLIDAFADSLDMIALGFTESNQMTLEQMIAKAHEGYFVRDAGRNLVICPQGETLRTMGELVAGMAE